MAHAFCAGDAQFTENVAFTNISDDEFCDSMDESDDEAGNWGGRGQEDHIDDRDMSEGGHDAPESVDDSPDLTSKFVVILII
jgi:hypothetical protein